MQLKEKIHPEYQKTTITCACGAVYHVGSTKNNIRVEICAKCHPFFTGVQKIVDTGSRVERFRQSTVSCRGRSRHKNQASSDRQ